jgi:hypothetical protein
LGYSKSNYWIWKHHCIWIFFVSKPSQWSHWSYWITLKQGFFLWHFIDPLENVYWYSTWLITYICVSLRILIPMCFYWWWNFTKWWLWMALPIHPCKFGTFEPFISPYYYAYDLSLTMQLTLVIWGSLEGSTSFFFM